MRTKLQKFTVFANGLLPHETSYLLAHHRFEDKKKLEILQKIDFNCRNVHQFTPYDEREDKRKYSNLKSWIEERLREIDVDAQYEWILKMDQQIMSDSINAEEEKELLKAIKTYDARSFYFIRFFELVLNYRQFLLIRLRYADHKLADDFLSQYKEANEYARSVGERMHLATLDIVQQYSGSSAESLNWEQWLTEVFYNEQLDGWNRYQALVRLTFLYFNYRDFERLRDKYDYMEELFSKGVHYSKRLLLNYYSNRVLLHARFREFDKAEYYGYLSVRGKNNDYLQYVNNLCAILLRQHKHQEAIRLMREALPEMKRSISFHNKTGFVSFYIRSLNGNQLYKNAESYAESFLRVYPHEIFEHRWHLFFSAYLESLLSQQKFMKMLKVIRRYKLPERDKKYQKNAAYLPTLLWYQGIAEYRNDKLSSQDLYQRLSKDLQHFQEQPDKLQQLHELLVDIRTYIPDIYPRLEGKFVSLRDG